MQWTRKYAPKRISDVKGQDKPIAQLKEFVNSFERQKKKAALIYGAPGCGKTSSAYALAEEFGLELVEVNASDCRNKDELEQRIGIASKQMSFFSDGKIILVDEIDGISGKNDRGGIPALVKIIKETHFPIIMTANNPWDKKFSSLRSSSILVKFNTLAYTSIIPVLRDMLEKEDIKYDENVLKILARRAGGDLRAAVNDLQVLTISGKLTEEELEIVSERKQTETMMQALNKIFKTKNLQIALGAFKDVDEDLDKTFLWIDENMPKEYLKPKDLAKGFDNLSLADIYNGRIRRWQYWRFMVYCYSFLTAGIALAKEEKYGGFTQYEPTKRILKLWMANMKYQKRKAIAEKIALHTHTSNKVVMRSTLPFMQQIFKNDCEASAVIADDLELDSDEVAWLRK